MLFLIAEIAAIGVSVVKPGRARAAAATPGQGFTVTAGDLHFIMKQIKIAEHHSATLTADNPCGTLVGDGPDQIPDRLTPYGLRTVDGSCNNLFPARERFAASDELFPRLTERRFRDAGDVPTGFPDPAGTHTQYAQKTGNVYDDTARVASNLIVDQTVTNPAAVAAAGHPVRSQDPTASSVPCKTDPVIDPTTGSITTPGDPLDCTPTGKTLFIPNVTTDVGLSPPYNSWFTFFGQFFDHGVDQTVKSGASVVVPLRADDPLRGMPNGPDGRPNTGDEIHTGADGQPKNDFMVLTRAKNQPGPDRLLGTADDIQDATNTDTPLVDQSQTYTSHASHQVFLREYVPSNLGRDGIDGNADDGQPVANGKLLGDSLRTPGIHGDTGMATWASVKRQARDLLGINLLNKDVLDIPMLMTDPYGEFVPGPNGLPQIVLWGPDGVLGDRQPTTNPTQACTGPNQPNGCNEARDDSVLEGNATTPVNVPADAAHFDTPFVGDIAHNADPSIPGSTNLKTEDADDQINPVNQPRPRGTFDDELLNTHFAAGDGRVNENIALTAVHQIFHSEHDRLVTDIEKTLRADTSAQGQDDLTKFWQAGVTFTQPVPDTTTGATENWNGDRLFQAARFITEMEYQHLVFEEFARKVQPAVRPFHVYHSDLNPVIPAEFAHAVYRFGHSMLDDTVARKVVDRDGTPHESNLLLLDAFLNPPNYFDSGDPANPFTPEQAAGAIIMGSVDQEGNELDEFVTETLRNNLLGLPLDLPTINMTRAREAGVPPLNAVRKIIHDQTNDAQMAPYTDWSDFGQHLKHPESLINYVAAYGQHPTIRDSGPNGIPGDGDDVLTLKAKRDAARAIVDPQPATDTTPADVPPDDAAAFLFSTGFWATHETGINDVDLWVGGLGEVTNLFGGLLGSTFNYVFQNTLENLQDGDRLYYLNRTPGMNLRTQLEGNSFAELVERNTDGTHTLKADVFATADCKFEPGRLQGPANTTNTSPPPPDYPAPLLGAGTVLDDPNTDCDENQLLLRKPDGTVQYRSRNKLDPSGINGQAVYNGKDDKPPFTDPVDRIFGGNDNDTIWGNEGNDILEGGGGDDVTQGGPGDDIETDLDGADVQEGGDGDDAMDGGTLDDLLLGGNGQDFTEGGSFDNETFGGPDNDFMNLGQGADAAFGDGGDDWMQGGSGQDLLQGDHGAFFFDDPGERSAPGNEIMVGEVGENDYDAEGGDDIMSQNSAIDRNAGAAGFDWAIHQYDTVGADDDMAINNNLVNNLPVVVNRDRWQETEGDSGSPFNDTIRGDEAIPVQVGGAGFTGCDALDQRGLNRIPGLDPIVPPLNTPAANVARALNMECPFLPNTNVWGDGNILLGGGGSDIIEGRGGDDIIDGDKALHVRIVVKSSPTGDEIGSTDLMEHKALTGSFGGTSTPTMTLSQAVFAGAVDPGNLDLGRRIDTESPAAGQPTPQDTAVFTGPRANYTISAPATDGAITVRDNVGTDGTDTLRGIEVLRFNGITGTDVPIAATPTVAPSAGVNPAFGDQAIGTTSTARQFTVTNIGLNTLTFGTPKFSFGGANADNFVVATTPATTCGTTLASGASCTVNVQFKPLAPAGNKNATLVTTSNTGVAGSTPISGNATLAPPQTAPTGVPTVTVAPAGVLVPVVSLLSANTTGIADVNGIVGAFRFQWQQTAANGTAFTNIAAPAGTAATFRVPAVGSACRSYRVQVSFTDGLGKAEGPLTSAPTGRVGGPLCSAPPAAAAAVATAGVSTAPAATALGQALAPLLSPAPLTAGSVRVTASSSSPLAISTTVPAGASTVAITLFRVTTLEKRTSAGATRRSTSTKHIGTVYRKAPKAKRYVFQLTEKPFRNLKPGRYLVQVRVGTSRTTLGPATSRQVTIRKGRTTSAR
jgi:Ca2+-binding RTX toxin-like protein